jgi:hypothetical protein
MGRPREYDLSRKIVVYPRIHNRKSCVLNKFNMRRSRVPRGLAQPHFRSRIAVIENWPQGFDCGFCLNTCFRTSSDNLSLHNDYI